MRMIGWAIACLVSTNLWAAGGDSIRGNAPYTALILDARAGNESELLSAYRDRKIDFFLDIEAPSAPATRSLYALRETGRLIEAGDFAAAEQRLRSIDKNRFKNEVIYLQGVLDAALKRYESSLESFRELIDNRSELSNHMTNLAFMGAARVFHEVGDYKQAIYHYTMVRQLEPEFFEAVFEKAWSFYQDGDMNGALGVTLSFLSPYFDQSFFPEAFVVRAAAFYQMCYFDRANLTVQQFKKDYQPILNQIRDLRSRDPRTWLFDDAALNKVNPRIVGGLMANENFRSLLRAYFGLKSEMRGSRSANLNLTTQAVNTVQYQLAQQTQRMLGRMDELLTKTLAQMDVISIEILQRQANILMGRNDSEIPVRTIDLGDVDFDGLVQFWPFRGEFWVDELGSYYYGFKSNCEG